MRGKNRDSELIRLFSCPCPHPNFLITFILLILLGLLFGSTLAAAPYVSASVDGDNRANFPLQGTLTITHDKSEKVDEGSALLEDKKLSLSFVKDVPLNAGAGALISIFTFELPSQEAGSYLLSPVSVVIAGRTYTSLPAPYTVTKKGAAVAFSSSSDEERNSPVVFKLEAKVDGPSILYPGERTKLVYYIAFNRSVDLTASSLPLVHPSHFKKVGDVHAEDKQVGDLTVQQLTQEVEARDIGEFSLGPSTIEGYAYTMNLGNKVYAQELLKAEAPAVTLVVKQLPEERRPPSLTNGLGVIVGEATLQESGTISVGDTLHLRLAVSGIENLSDYELPPLKCQVGWSGFFQLSPLPPLAVVKGKVKDFDLEIRPMTPLLQGIPSIRLASFDPDTKKYVVVSTPPIPIAVREGKLDFTRLVSVPPFNAAPLPRAWPQPTLPPLRLLDV